MILRATLSITILLLGLAPARAHVPEGTVLGIWQWPLEALPVMDGDLSEWEVVPDSLWLDLNTLDADGNPLFWAVAGGETGRPGTEADPADLTIRVAVGWNDETDRLYFAQHRLDDIFDRDGEEPPGVCGGEDNVWVNVDADHSGGWLVPPWVSDEPGWTGRNAQSALFLFPPIVLPPPPRGPTAWHWMWTSSAAWHDKEPYSCCPESCILEGEHGAEATLTAEWWSVYYNELIYNSPEDSVPADLSEGQIIGMGIRLCDADLGSGYDEADSRAAAWSTGGPASNAWVKDNKYLSDWILLPVSDFWTSVEHTSWGQVKASFTP
ncbi:MAG: hypothetical protein OXG13_20065 [Gemmatimonadaceae bacterium]|nr:hypothetical protein [Gemmatimonadaceae bacterium]